MPRLKPLTTSTSTVGSPTRMPPTKAQNAIEMLLLMIADAITGSSSSRDWAFVGGILVGLPTVLVLVVNGLSLGMGFGLFVNYHAGGYLATFVAGHGVLELTAIFIAGGAGFRVAGDR